MLESTISSRDFAYFIKRLCSLESSNLRRKVARCWGRDLVLDPNSFGKQADSASLTAVSLNSVLLKGSSLK
jgi:hypothetical protein